VPPLFPLTAAGLAGVREERELARPPAPQATSATSPLVGDHRGAAEVRGIDRSQSPAPPSRYRLAKDKLADLMAAGNRAGTDQAHKHGVLVLKTPSRAPLKCSTASFLPVREQRRCSGTTACSREMPRQELGDGLGCAAGGPFDGSRRTIAISQGQDRAAVGCTRLSVDTVERALDAYERLRR
jgi:hypothetical protein